MKYELQNIISGKSEVRHGDAIQAIADYLRRSKGSSCEAKDSKQIKREEAEIIKQYCNQNNFGKQILISILLFPAVLSKRCIFIRMSLPFLNSMTPFIIYRGKIISITYY